MVGTILSRAARFGYQLFVQHLGACNCSSMKILVLCSERASPELNAAVGTLQITGHTAQCLASGMTASEACQVLTDKQQRGSKAYAAAEARDAGLTPKQLAFKAIASSEAVLVINPEVDGVTGYIGASVLMEMALAHCQNKPIFVLNEMPDATANRWVHEVDQLDVTCLNGKLENLPKTGPWEGLG